MNFSHAKLIPNLILALVALFVAAWFCWANYHSSTIAACAADESCSLVLASSWSQFFIIPVSYLGLIAYLIHITCLFILSSKKASNPRITNIAARLSLFICYTIILSGIWFTYTQAFLIKSFCPLCSAAHVSASVSSILTIIQLHSRQASNQQHYKTLFVAIAGVSLLATLQSIFPHEPKGSRLTKSNQDVFIDSLDTIFFYKDIVKIDKNKLPHTVSSNTKECIVLHSDYTCPHCIKQHLNIIQNKDDFAKYSNIYFLPAFHTSSSKEINRLLLIIRKTSYDLYIDLLNEINNQNIPISLEDIKSYANKKLNNQLDLYSSTHFLWSEELLTAGKKLMKLNLEQQQVAAFPQLIGKSNIIEGSTNIKEFESFVKSNVNSSQYAPPKLTLTSEDNTLIINNYTEILGRAIQGQILDSSFTLSNPTNKDIKISKWRVSCGCIQLPNKPMIIAAKSSIVVPFTFSTKKFNNTITHKIFIFEEGVRKAITIPATVKIWNAYKTSPTKLNFGKVKMGEQSSEKSITLINNSVNPITLSLNSEKITRLNLKLVEIIKGSHYQIKSHITKMPNNNIKENIILNTSDPDYPIIKIPIFATSTK